MSRRRAGVPVNGIFLLDKPAGISSNKALQAVRRLLNARKAGHTGTLDPFATGMLPICLGEASKTASFMMDAAKTYRATAQLGMATNTGDIEGEVVDEAPVPFLDDAAIDKAMHLFRGRISQVPPMYSAIKHEGKPLYKLARQGVEVERKARQVQIHRLALLKWNPPLLDFEVYCSKGTYIRTLAEDLGKQLGTCGHLAALRRLAVDPFEESQMVSFESLESAVTDHLAADLILPLDAGLPAWPRVDLSQQQSTRFCHGNPAEVDCAEGWARVYGPDETPVGLGQVTDDGLLVPKRVFVNPPDKD